MSDFPWFPFWVDDFTNARRVKLMSLEAIGLYTLLLCEQWKEGPIPNDVESIARLCRRDSDAIGDAWNEVRPCFTETPEGLVNKRLEEERMKQETKRKRYQKAGKKGAEKRWAQQDNSNANGDAIGDAKENPKTESESDTDKKKKHVRPDYSDDFEAVWKTHPRGSKKKAWPEYRKAVPKRIDHDSLLSALKSYVRSELQDDFRGVHLERWIRDDRWEEQQTKRNGTRKPSMYADRHNPTPWIPEDAR